MAEEISKPNCYECKWRGALAGDAHSKCVHPETGLKNDGNPFILSFRPDAKEKLKIEGHETGVKGGWFMWPINFDPRWLLSCNGFTKKDLQK